MKENLLLKLVFTTLLFLGILFSCSKTEKDDGLLADSYPSTLIAYFSGVKTPLKRVDGKFYIAFFSKDEEILTSELSKVGIDLSKHVRTKVKDYSHYTDMTGSGAATFIDFQTGVVDDNYKTAVDVLSSYAFCWAPYYRKTDGNEIVPTELFTVILKPTTTIEQLEALANENGVEMIGWGSQSYMTNWYRLICTNSSKGNPFKTVALFHESGLFEEVFNNCIGGLSLEFIP